MFYAEKWHDLISVSKTLHGLQHAEWIEGGRRIFLKMVVSHLSV